MSDFSVSDDASQAPQRLRRAARFRALVASVDVARIAFAVVIAALVGVQGVLVYQGFTSAGVEVDEGLFLEVIHDAGEGDGYAVRGLYVASGQEQFSTIISTGPTLLAPAAAVHALGVDTLLAGRMTALAFYAGLLAALWVIGNRIGGRWAGLAATLGPVMLDAFTNDQSPILAPQSVLGEYTAAAMIAWAIVFARRRPGVAGVFVGFAFLAKVVTVFLIPAVVIAIVLARTGATRRRLIRDLARFVAAALVPLLVFEAIKFVTLGRTAYFALVPTYWRQLEGRKLVNFMVNEKTESLWRAWFLPASVAMALVALALVLLTGMLTSRFRHWKDAGLSWRAIASDDRFVLAISGVMAGVFIVLAWFALKSTNPEWLRHPAPGLVIAAGTGAAILVAAGSALRRWGRRARPAGTTVVAVTVLVLALVSLRHDDASLRPSRFGYLSEQRAVADEIVASGTHEVQGVWGPIIPLAALANVRAHSILLDASPDDLLVIDMYFRGQLRDQGRVLRSELCGEIIYDYQVVLCWPRPDIAAIVKKDFEPPASTGGPNPVDSAG